MASSGVTRFLQLRAQRLARHWKLVLAIAVAATALATLVSRLGYLEGVDNAAYDRALKDFTAKTGRSGQVVVLGIDNETLTRIGRDRTLRDQWGTWPFYRGIWALTLDHLNREGARALVFDLVMEEPATGDADYVLQQAIDRSRIPVYLGFGVQPGRAPLPPVTETNLLPGEVVPPPPGRAADASAEDVAEADGQQGAAEGVFDARFAIGGDEEETQEAPTPADDPSVTAETTAPSPSREDDPDVQRWIAERLAFPVKGGPLASLASGRHEQAPIPPVEGLLGVLDGVGMVEPEADVDGVLRRTRFAYASGENTFVTLPIAVMADLLRSRELAVSPGTLQLGPHAWRINDDGTARIDYGGTLADRFHVYPLIDLLEDATNPDAPRTLPADAFRDKVVIVGGLALATHDSKATPFSALDAGVVKQAATLDALLGGRFIVDAPLWWLVVIGFVVALTSAAIGKAFESTLVNLGWVLLLVPLSLAITGLLLRHAHSYVPTTVPVLAGVTSSFATLALARLLADRNREMLKESFVRYLDRTLVEQMAESNELPKLEGENREITAFFSDIRGFSTFSEGLRDDPKKLVRILNTYLTRVSAALMREGGCLDKYIGDAVVCLFGAPLRQSDHAVRACRGALAVQAEVAKLREEFRAQGLPDVYTRIGLNSGVMFVGNFGSDQLFDYTAMGDDMNLASRLEGANKAYDTAIMIGEKTWALARDHIEVRELDRVRVAGKSQPVTVYELLAMKGDLPPERARQARDYEAALAQYRERRFKEALQVLTNLLAEAPGDGPALALQKRCEKYRHLPPEQFDPVANLEK